MIMIKMMIRSNALGRLICQSVLHILTSVLQNLCFRRVQVTLSCGAHDILTPMSTQAGPPGFRINAAERLICEIILDMTKKPLPELLL